MWAFLAAAVGPLAVRALVAIGFASVSFAGVSTAFAGLVTYAQSAWGGLPADVLMLASLAQVPAALGLIFGAMTARLGIWASINATKLIFKG